MPQVQEHTRSVVNTSRAIAHSPRSSGVSFPAVMPVQFSLIVKDGDAYTEFNTVQDIMPHISEDVANRADIATLLAFWGAKDNKHFSGWATAISEASKYILYLKGLDVWTEDRLDLLKLKDAPLKVQPGVLNSVNLERGDRAAVDAESEKEISPKY